MSWDPFQRDVLAELGIELYVLAGADDARAAMEEPAPEALPARPQAAARMESPSRAESRPAARAPIDTRAVLLRQLLRAAGGESREQAVLALAEPLSGLRGNPAAKRALWPLLRRLRRP